MLGNAGLYEFWVVSSKGGLGHKVCACEPMHQRACGPNFLNKMLKKKRMSISN